MPAVFEFLGIASNGENSKILGGVERVFNGTHSGGCNSVFLANNEKFARAIIKRLDTQSALCDNASNDNLKIVDYEE